MTHILVIWTVVAIHGSQYGNTTDREYAWRPIGAFSSGAACNEAAGMLGKKPGQYRCLPNGAKS